MYSRFILLTFLLISCGKKTQLIVRNIEKPTENCYLDTRDTDEYIVCNGDEFKLYTEEEADQIDLLEGYLEIVEICPKVKTKNPDTLLYLNGKYLTFFETDKKKEGSRLTLLEEDIPYQTSDSRKIKFYIEDGELYYITKECKED